MKLTKKQYEAAKAIERKEVTEVLFGGAAAGGKTFLGAVWLVSMATRYNGCRLLMGRAKLKTLKQTTLVTFKDACSKLGVDYKINQIDSTITVGDSLILMKDLFAYPSDPEFDELGSLEVTGAFIDEVQQVSEKAVNIVKTRIRYKLTEFDLYPKLLMGCNPAKNWLYTEWYEKWKSGTLPKDKIFIQSTAGDNFNVSPHYIEALRKSPEPVRRRLLYGDWDYAYDDSALIPYSKILDVYTNKADSGEKFITVDPARYGADRAVIFVWVGWEVVSVSVTEASSLKELGDKVKQLAAKYQVGRSNIVADADGLGGGLVDFLGIEGFVNNASVAGNFQNLKAQAGYYFADKVNKAKVRISTEAYKQEIIEELGQLKSYKQDDDGKMKLLPKVLIKENIGRSPDFLDALIMRAYFDINRQAGAVEVW